MPSLNEYGNAVLQEWGGILPGTILAMEDCRREFLYTRALELQKIGIADTDKTVTSTVLDVSEREGTVSLGDIIPAAVEYQPTAGYRERVMIVQVDDIPNYEGSRAIALYGDPLKYRLAWNAWEHGTLYLFYDPIEDITQIQGAATLTFPAAFWTFLVKKTAFNLASVVRTKLCWLHRNEEKEQLKFILDSVDAMEKRLKGQVDEWQNELKRWMNKDMNEQPILRRSNEEIWARQDSQPLPSFLFDG